MPVGTRLITLDTETTGLDAAKGDRIIEIGCVALDGRLVMNSEENHLQLFINPEREVPAEAVAIHGITTEFLADKPKFVEVADRFLRFVSGSTLIIHNAAFDTGFLNMELARIGRDPIESICQVVDTVKLAKKLLPGKSVSLDSLCRYYEIDNSNRTLHGALLDAELLAEVYVALTRGQDALTLVAEGSDNLPPIPPFSKFRIVHASPEELTEHERILDIAEKKAKATPAWRRHGVETAEEVKKAD